MRRRDVYIIIRCVEDPIKCWITFILPYVSIRFREHIDRQLLNAVLLIVIRHDYHSKMKDATRTWYYCKEMDSTFRLTAKLLDYEVQNKKHQNFS